MPHASSCCRLAGLVAVLLLACAAGAPGLAHQAEPDAPLEAVLRRAAAYVSQYRDDLGSVIADERYDQTVTTWIDSNRRRLGTGQRQARHLVSELLLFVRPGDDEPWIAFRDVFEVDGTPVTDRQARFEEVFRESPEIGHELWQKLVAESARFNLGDVARNINVPPMALQLLGWSDRRRLSFTKAGEERLEVPTWVIEFEERMPPTLIRNQQGEPLFGRGTLWIEPGTGRVVQTRLRTDDPSVHLQTQVDVRYRPEPRLGIWVPSRMTERYLTSTTTIRRTQEYVRRITEIRCVATYTNVRRFEVEMRITGTPP